MDKNFTKGVYRLNNEMGDYDCDMAIFDGKNFFICGWEIPLEPSSSFSIDVNDIEELLYEWKPKTS